MATRYLSLTVQGSTELDAEQCLQFIPEILRELQARGLCSMVSGLKLDVGDVRFSSTGNPFEARLQWPIDDLNLPETLRTRILKALERRKGIRTVGDLVKCKESDITQVRCLGAKCLDALKASLAEIGLCLR